MNKTKKAILILVCCLPAVLLVLPFVLCGEIGNGETPYEIAKANYLSITNEPVTYGGSAMAISTHRVMTCEHLAKRGAIFVEGKMGQVIYSNEELDVAVLEFETAHFAPHVKFPERIYIGQPLFSLNNTFGMGPLWQPFWIAKVTEDGIIVTPSTTSGSSGAAVYTMRGEFTGMIVAHLNVPPNEAASVGLLIPVSKLRGVIQRFQSEGGER